MLINYSDDSDLVDVLLRLLVNLTSPTLLFFLKGSEDLPKDGAGRRTYLDLIEISQNYKDFFSTSSSLWATLAARLQKILEIVSENRTSESLLN